MADGIANDEITRASGQQIVELPRGRTRFAALGSAVACRGFQLRSQRHSRRLELPTGAVTMVFGFGDALRLTDAADPGGATVLTSLVSGVRETARIGEQSGSIGGIEVSMTPMMAYAVFGAAMYELAQEAVDPVELFGPAAASLSERLAELTNWRDRFALIDRLLTDRLAVGTRCCPEVSWAWRQFYNTAPGVRDVLAQTGWSRRRMERRFREYIGVSPKAVAQVSRLQQALRLFATPMPLAGIAVRAGYYDQAHLARTVKVMTGRTPTQLRAERARGAFTARADRLPGRITTILLSE